MLITVVLLKVQSWWLSLIYSGWWIWPTKTSYFSLNGDIPTWARQEIRDFDTQGQPYMYFTPYKTDPKGTLTFIKLPPSVVSTK